MECVWSGMDKLYARAEIIEFQRIGNSKTNLKYSKRPNTTLIFFLVFRTLHRLVYNEVRVIFFLYNLFCENWNG